MPGRPERVKVSYRGYAIGLATIEHRPWLTIGGSGGTGSLGQRIGLRVGLKDIERVRRELELDDR